LAGDLDDFFLLEDAEALLECKERILSVFHDQIDVCFGVIEVVQFDYVIMLEEGK
jgi:hypothetical protein